MISRRLFTYWKSELNRIECKVKKLSFMSFLISENNGFSLLNYRVKKMYEILYKQDNTIISIYRYMQKFLYK